MKKVYTELFENMEWSSDSVFSSTVKKAKSIYLKVQELPLLRDIDTKKELKLWLSQTNNPELKRKILSLLNQQNPEAF
jgi:glycosyltransferase A (GT-A) superfamily protein (DUF2064 family)